MSGPKNFSTFRKSQIGCTEDLLKADLPTTLNQSVAPWYLEGLYVLINHPP